MNGGFQDTLQARPRRARLAWCDLEIVEEHRAGKCGPVADEQARLQADEGDRAIRTDGLTERYAGITVEAGWNIHGEHRKTGAVDVTDDTRYLVACGPAEPGTQQGIHDDLSLRQVSLHIRLDLKVACA